MREELEKVYDKYASELYKYALMISADHGTAEDAVQQVFVKMLKMGNRVLQIESYNGYLRRAVRNECYEIIKKRNLSKGIVEKLSSKPIIENSDEKEANEEERELLEGVIKELAPEQREVLHMKVFEDKTLSEIGEMTGVSTNTAASRYRYAMDKLREILFLRKNNG